MNKKTRRKDRIQRDIREERERERGGGEGTVHGRERRKGEKRKNKRNEEERATSVGFQETASKLS